MDIDIENIEDLKNNDSALENTPLPEKKVDEHGRAYATGKRKNAVARVWLKPGSGIIKINGKNDNLVPNSNPIKKHPIFYFYVVIQSIFS